jgi:hypothetical protein
MNQSINKHIEGEMKKIVALLLLAASVALAEGKTVIQLDCIPNYANWGGVAALY